MDYDFITSDGVKKKIKVEKVGTPVMLNQKWEITFPDGCGAPEKITLPKLFFCINTKTKELSISQVQLPI